MLRLYNTLSRSLEDFVPIHPPEVGMYTCGMTVYDYAHIGHGRKYVGDDILRRTLERFSYQVKHVQNVTDVGHLSSDADAGEDKMEKGAKKVGKTVWEVAQFFTDHFYSSMDKLNILRPHVICKATDHIKEQIALVEKLVARGLAYDTEEAVYFDISKFPSYGKLFGQQLDEKKVAVRQEVQTGDHKKHSADFALWFKRVGRFTDHAMHWDSPWGEGFPGWHIECSAMSMKYLGESFDIHTGGIDHIPVHHPNEIAQSEGATGKPFVKYWVHHGFLMVDGTKMSKSLGNIYTIEDVVKKGFDPLALRYFYLTARYRAFLNFTWEGLGAAQNSLNQLREIISSLPKPPKNPTLPKEFQNKFQEALENDLNMPQALAVVWEVAKSTLSPEEKYALLLDFDSVLGLGLKDVTEGVKKPVPEEVDALAQKREELRNQKKFAEADSVRKQIEEKGFIVKDSPGGYQLSRI